MKIKDLTPAEYNPRKITEEKLAALKKSLAEFGDLSGIVFNRRTARLIGGHQRIKTFDLSWPITKEEMQNDRGTVAHGYVETPHGRMTYREVDWPEEKEKAANIAANKHGGEWDEELLAELLAGLKENKIAADLLGFEDAEIDEIIAAASPQETKDAEPQFDKAAELNKIWQVRLGDLWQIGEHRLLCGDSTKVEDVACVMGGGKIDAIITDIPYNVDLNAKNLRLKKIGRGKDWGDMANDVLPAEIYQNFLKSVFKNMVKTMSEKSAFYIWYGGLWHGVVSAVLDDVGLKIWRVIIWVKPHFVLSILPYQWRHEPCVMGWRKGGQPNFKHIPANETTVWEETYEGKKMASGNHPTQKPVNLIERCIAGATCKHNTIICDPFLGSGTTMVAAQNLNRKCYGIEISPDYCAVILQRMTDAFPGIEIKRISET